APAPKAATAARTAQPRPGVRYMTPRTSTRKSKVRSTTEKRGQRVRRRHQMVSVMKAPKKPRAVYRTPSQAVQPPAVVSSPNLVPRPLDGLPDGLVVDAGPGPDLGFPGLQIDVYFFHAGQARQGLLHGSPAVVAGHADYFDSLHLAHGSDSSWSCCCG